MSNQTATRLTCFGFISAIEQDVREHIAGLLGNEPEDFLSSDALMKASRRYADALGTPPKADDDCLRLLEFCDFADLAAALRKIARTSGRSGIELKMAELMESASPARNRICHSRPLEPEDFPSVMDLVEHVLDLGGSFPSKHLRETKARFEADPASVYSIEIPEFWRDRTTRPMHNLPPTEFDETGFLGRWKDREALKRLILSPHPVVTVVGEGGVGKTALALRCLYDLAGEGDAQPYDAVVWVSLKTTALVVGGTKEVRDSVRDVLGLLRQTANGLGIPELVEPDRLLEEILDYMRAFRILLAIDNLETLAAGDLRRLLIDLPERSKVLLTSRVPLGEFEVRYALDRLDDTTAKLLARRYAGVLNVRSIAAAPDAEIQQYTDALFGNPLLIKWFIAAVAAGAEPGRLLSGQHDGFDEAVAFCFQNLFDRLSEMERQVLYSIAAARKPLTRGELILLLHKPVIEIDRALVTLSNSSMVGRPTSRQGDAFSLTPIASTFIARLRPPTSELVQQVTADLAHVRRLAQSDKVARAGYEYDPSAFEWKTRDELIAASMLKVAQYEERHQDFEAALRRIRDAGMVAPTFSEVFRVEARVRSRMGDLYRAAEAYERAIALAPESPRLHYFYGLFLMLDVQDHLEALKHLSAAETLDPKHPATIAATAMALMRLGQYDNSAARYEKLLADLSGVPRKHRVSIRDQAADCYRRWASRDAENEDEVLFVEHFRRATAILRGAFVDGDADLDTVGRLAMVFDEATQVARARGSDSIARALTEALLAWPAEHTGPIERWFSQSAEAARFIMRFRDEAERLVVRFPSTEELSHSYGEEEFGAIHALKGRFGFLATDGGDRLYFNARTCDPPDAFLRLSIGCRVAYRRGHNENGPCAVGVRPVEGGSGAASRPGSG